mgnify:CR=1 FL=1
MTFVNLQYGDVEQEMAQAKAMGVELWTPPGIDLKNDKDWTFILGPGFTPSGVVRIANLQAREQFVYIKP